MLSEKSKSREVRGIQTSRRAACTEKNHERELVSVLADTGLLMQTAPIWQ